MTLAESDEGRPARLGRWLREPMVHFVAIGLLLFVGYRLLHPDAGAQPGRIVLTEDDLRQISLAWLAQGRPPLTPEQMKSLIESKVREEILYREALALGLEKEDTIVKRRLAQKMEFLADDVAALREPSGAELRTWFEKNSARFAMSPRTSFRHVYFSLDRGGERAHDAAAKALPRLGGKRGDWSGAASLGDPFMFQDYYGDRSLDQLASVFGPGFAREVVELKPGAWRGPIESGYGWHLIWVESITPGRVPAFEEVEPDVKTEWTAEQREETKRKAFEAMRSRYEVVLPVPAGNVGGGAAPTRKSLP